MDGEPSNGPSAELADRLPYPIVRAMDQALWDAIREGKWASVPADFSHIKYAAAWRYLRNYRDAGKKSAYGPLQEQVNEDANSHAFRGFLVGWAMCEAMHTAQAVEGGDA